MSDRGREGKSVFGRSEQQQQQQQKRAETRAYLRIAFTAWLTAVIMISLLLALLDPGPPLAKHGQPVVRGAM